MPPESQAICSLGIASPTPLIFRNLLGSKYYLVAVFLILGGRL